MASSSQGVDLTNFITKLHSNSSISVKKTLQALTKITRKSDDVKKFREKGGLKVLIELISTPNQESIDMALSVLANCALEEQARKEVLNLNGIPAIAKILENVKVTSIQNRAARALANLGKNKQCAIMMQEMDCNKNLLTLLQEETNEECKHSALRAVRELCFITSVKQEITVSDGLKTIVEIMKSKSASLRNECIRILAVLTQHCTKELAQQIQEFEGIKPIIEAASDDKIKIQQSAVQCLANLAHLPHVRVCLCTEGAITALVKHVTVAKTDALSIAAVEAVCLCCREAVNRNKVVECGGLELLVRMFSTKRYNSCHEKIAAALVCFFYHEIALQKMVSVGFVSVLIKKLSQLVKRNKDFRNAAKISPDQMKSSCSTSVRDHPEFSPNSSADSSFSTRESPPNSKRFCIEVEKMQETFDIMVSEHRTSLDQQKNSKTPDFKLRRKQRQRSTEKSPDLPTDGISTSNSVGVLLSNRSTGAHLIPENQQTQNSAESELTVDVIMSEPSDSISASKTHSSDSNISPNHKGQRLSCVYPQSEADAYLSSPVRKQTLSSSMVDSDNLSPTNVKTPYVDVSSGWETHSYTPCAKLHTPPSPEKDQFMSPHQQDIEQNILLLLWRFSHLLDSDKFLISRNLFEVLLDYLILKPTPSSHCVRLLQKLTGITYFEANIRENIVPVIHRHLCCSYGKDYFQDDPEMPEEEQGASLYNMSTSQKLSLSPNHVLIGQQLLSNLASIAMSPFGKGVLAHMLLSGSPNDHMDCVLSLPYLCRNKRIQKKMLYEYHGIKLLFKVLRNMLDEETEAMAIESVVTLVSTLDLTCNGAASTEERRFAGDDNNQGLLSCAKSVENPPISDKNSKILSVSCCSLSHCQYDSQDSDTFDVVFMLDNGDTFHAHRHILSSKSSVFEALLSQNYAEAERTVIPLKGTQSTVFMFVVHRAYGCEVGLQQFSQLVKNTDSSSDSYKHNSTNSKDDSRLLHFYMDVHIFADKFFLDSLKLECEQYIVAELTKEYATLVYQHGKHFHAPKLCESALRYMILREADLKARYHCLKHLLNSEEKEHVLEELKAIIA